MPSRLKYMLGHVYEHPEVKQGRQRIIISVNSVAAPINVRKIKVPN